MKDQSVVKRFIELRTEGKSIRTIAEELNISRSCAVKWHKKYSKVIRQMQQLKIDEYMDKCNLDRLKHFFSMAEYLSKLEEEISKRGFKELSTKELLKETNRVRKEIFSMGFFPKIHQIDTNLLDALDDTIDNTSQDS